jgi:glycogen debranching enzyme
MQHLNTLRTVSQIVNGNTGKVVHEISSTGAVYYGDTTEPGDINETAQFDIAAGLVWQWSGDQAFLHQNYAFIRAGLHYLTGLEPGGRDDLWPDGAGIVENPALGNDALDVASETVQALGVLHEMALAMGDHSTAAWAAQHQQAMLKAFHQWWISSQHLYADSICDGTEGDCSHADQRLQQRWWTTVAPMEQGIAPAANADAALARMEGPTFTGTCGLFVDGVGGPSGTGGQTCYLVNTGAMARAEANYGRTSQAVSYMDKVASQLTVEMPGSLPELAASAQYNPFEPFTSRANVMQAWSSYGVVWTVVNDLLGVTADVPRHAVAVVPEVPASWPSFSVTKLRVGSQELAVTASHQAGTYRTQVSGAARLTLTIGTVLPAGSKPGSVTLNGQNVHYKLVTTTRGTAVEVFVKAPAAQETLAVQTAG